MKKQQCPSCGFHDMEHKTDHSEIVRLGNSSLTVEGLAGWFCPECGEAVLDDESSRRYGAAGDMLVQQHREEIKREIKVFGPNSA